MKGFGLADCYYYSTLIVAVVAVVVDFDQPDLVSQPRLDSTVPIGVVLRVVGWIKGLVWGRK